MDLIPALPVAFYLLSVPAVLLTGISKGGFGGALGGLAVPLMSLVIAPTDAAAIMLPILCLMDFVGLRAYFGKWRMDILRTIIPGALLGVAVGTLSFGKFSETAIQAVIGTIAILFAVYNLAGLASRSDELGTSRRGGVFWSALSGFTSFVAHAGGPPIMMYLIPKRLPAVDYVATMNAFFLVVNAVKVVPYFWNGQFTANNLMTSAVLAPVVPIGVWMGVWMTGRVNQRVFYRITQACLLATGAILLAGSLK